MATDTRLIQKMRGGTTGGDPIRHTVQVFHGGKVCFEGTPEAAEKLFDRLRFGSAAAIDIFTFAEGI